MVSKRRQFLIMVLLCVAPLIAIPMQQQGKKLEIESDRKTVVIEEGEPLPRVCFDVGNLSGKRAGRVKLYGKDNRPVQTLVEDNQLCTEVFLNGLQSYRAIETDTDNNAIASSDWVEVAAFTKLLVRPFESELLLEKNATTAQACFELTGDRTVVAKTKVVDRKDGVRNDIDQPHPRKREQCVDLTPGEHFMQFVDTDAKDVTLAESDELVITVLPELIVADVAPVHVTANAPTPEVCFKVTRNGGAATETILYRIDESGDYLIEAVRKPNQPLCIGVAVEGTHTYRVYDWMRNKRVAMSREVSLSVTTDMGVASGGNGIAVGRAKLFDDRALRTMQADVERALAGLQISLNNVGAAVNTFQAGITDRSFIGAQATTIPVPGTTTTATSTETATGPTHTTTTQTTSAGQTTTDNISQGGVNTQRQTQTTSSQGVINPNTATGTTDTSGFAFSQPSFSQSAQDLLVEHTELAAQATNLRLLLQRALSDRVLLYSDRSEPRLTPALGFQISVDPPKKYRNAVAEAIVTISSRWAGPQHTPEIVSLLPKEKTYNVAKLTNNTRAFSLGAVVQVLNIGGTFNFTRNRLYVVKDTDTVALERIPTVDTSPAAFGNVEFAWQFRPVLGEKSVTPGIRQVFAVLALPSPATTGDWGGIVRVRTQWRRYDPRSKTVVGEPIDGSITYQEPYFISVPSVAQQSRAIAARIDDLEWHDNGDGHAVVTLAGSFPTGTRVTVADKVIQSAAEGMLLREENRISVSVPVAKLVLGPPTVVDSFGVATQIRHPQTLATDSLEIVSAKGKTRESDPSQLDVTVVVKLPPRQSSDPGSNPEPRKLRQPVVFVGNRVYGISTGTLMQEPVGEGSYRLRFITPINDATVARTVRVIDLLHGDGIVREKEIEIPQDEKKATPTELHVLVSDQTNTTLAIIGRNFATDDSDEIRLRIGSNPIAPESGAPLKATFRQFVVGTPLLRSAQRIMVTFKGGEPVLFPVPRTAIDRPKVIKQETIVEGFSGKIRLEGVGLGSVQRVEYNRTEVKSSPVADDPSILFLEVLAGAALTGTPGEKDIELITSDGVRTPARLVVQPQAKK